jgi:hypothetical protein
MQAALDSSSGRASSNNTTSSPYSSSVSVLGLLQTVCTNPGAILGSVDSHNQSTQPYASTNLMESVVKQLLQLAATSASATSTSTAYHVTGAGSPLKNGVRACTCVVHLVLLQVWLERDGYAVFRFIDEWLRLALISVEHVLSRRLHCSYTPFIHLNISSVCTYSCTNMPSSA